MLVYQRQDFENWIQQNPGKPFRYLEPIFSPRAMETNSPNPFQYGAKKTCSDVGSNEDDDVVNNNVADDEMDTS